ncbi:phenylalanyl-tRNA synthetase beta subunit [Stackebrandtia albiflava]|uniref:Phenylalanine--tRNA ligase beta subunit n=1 Tax=Stackebrandtia albiflava TaxID=406432 RepID=A0A562VEH8_9ACTN|nr:phenylalanine--tRNA ligase subunit beta [Stackebrandtia albiflava]TWJ16296.1 phenylalanyl-tRNA synthetase beta subunit [Stackebrandtia albiflava]
MRVSLSWLRDYAALPADIDVATLDAAFVSSGLEVEEVHDLRDNVSGPLLIGRVVEIEELTGFKKPIRFCRVDVGESEPRGIVCGARNFVEGDLVVVSLPGAVLPGGFAISARKTYGRVSDGMIASSRELGAGDDHDGIIVLPEGAGHEPGTDARGAVGLDDVIFELAVTPDMSHCFSMRGVAREVAHRLDVEFTDPALATLEPTATEESPYPLSVEDTEGCDRFALRAVTGIDPTAPSPQWLRRRLSHAGMRSIGLAVDVTNYLMLELGQPLHAFDLATLKGGLVVRRARAGERLTTLDDVERRLDPQDMVICDDTGVISLAGVMGGQTSEVAPSTVDVLFEAAHWDMRSIAATARRHRLASEAAKRFERGSDPALCAVAVQRAVELLVEYGGGVADARVADVDHRVAREPIYLDPQLPGRIVGVPYTDTEVIARLTAAGCVVQAGGEVLEVVPPSWRPDVTDRADLVEEVVRLDGYDKVPVAMPTAPPGSGLTARQRRRRQIGRVLAEAGYVEALNYPFLDTAVLDRFGLPDDDPRRDVLRLANPLVESESALRTTLLPGLLRALKTNVDRGIRDVGLFELGVVFHPRPDWERVEPPRLPVHRRPTDEELEAAGRLRPDQPQHLAVAITGDAEPGGWWGAPRPADWTDAVAAARTVAEAAGVEVTVEAARYAPWHPGRCAALRVGDEVIGHAGELHPAVCDALEIPRRVAAMELDLSRLPTAEVTPAPRMSHYPVALIDVAVVVDDEVPAARVAEALGDGAGELLEGIRLFDVYRDERVGAGRKSLAYKLTFRAPDRTLTAEEAVAARDRAVAVASERFGAELRGV